MRNLIISCGLFCVLGCDASSPPAEKQPSSPSPEVVRTSDQVAAAALAKAHDQLRDSVVAAKVTTRIEQGGQRFEREAHLQLGPNDQMDWSGPGFHVVAAGGRLRATLDQVPDRVVDVPIQNGLLNTLIEVLGEMEVPPPMLVFRDEADPTVQMNAFSGGLLSDPILTASKQADGLLVLSMSGRGDGHIELSQDGLVLGSDASVDSMTFSMSLEHLTPGTIKPIELGQRMVVPDLIALTHEPKQRVRLDAGDEAPDFTLPASDGTTITLSSLRGKCVLLDYWATWCGPCKAGFPDINKIWAQTGENAADVIVLGVNVMDSEVHERVAAFWKTQPVNFPTVMATKKGLPEQWGLTGIPVTFVIDPNGVIVYRADGYRPGEWKHVVEVIESSLKAYQSQ